MSEEISQELEGEDHVEADTETLETSEGQVLLPASVLIVSAVAENDVVESQRQSVVALLAEEEEEEENPEISERRELIPTVGISSGKVRDRITFLSEEQIEDEEEGSSREMNGGSGTRLRTPTAAGPHKVALKKELTLLNGVAFVVGQIIGSGIFITPRIILGHTHSVFLSLALWVVGGLISLCGALCYCELGTFLKKSGGEYTYLLEAYSFKRRKTFLEFTGSLLAFLYIWASVLVMRPTGFAVITLVTGKYLAGAFYVDTEVPDSVMKLLAICAILILMVVNCYSVRWSARLMTTLSFMKVLSCMFIIILGGWELIRNHCFPRDACNEALSGEVDSSTASVHATKSAGDIALALYGVLLAYDGWNVLNYSVEEQENVEKNLPRAIWIGVPVVAVCYILVSIAFFAAVGSDQVLSGGPIALEFGEVMLGKPGAVLVSILVALSAFGAANGSLFATSRVIFSSARDGSLPEVLSGVHTSFKTPVPATLVNVPLTILFIVIGNIEELIDGMSAAIWVFYALTFAAVLVMRVTHRKDPRPYRVLLILPILMVMVSLFLIILPAQQKPLPSLLAFGSILLGVPVYVLFVMETPWRVRPKVFDRASAWLTGWSKEWLSSETSRET